MRHISEIDLILYAFHADSVTSDCAREIQRHTAICAECQSTLDFFSTAEEDLGDSDVWERVVGSETRSSLMEYAGRIRVEDEEAASLLVDFIESPASAAWTTLGSRRQFHTGGVVRALNRHAHKSYESQPLVALTFAESAISIAEMLPDDFYPANAVYQLRGTAWKEQAIAQLFLGDFASSLDSLRRAERAYRHLAAPALGLAIVALVRAGVFYEQQRFDEASEIAEQSERAFSHLGDKRRIDALFLRGSIKYEMRQLDAAVALFQQAIEYGEELSDASWIARGSHAIGVAEIDRQNLSEASLHLHRALILFRELGFDAHRVATEWGIARILLHSGKMHEAIRRFGDAAAEFESRGMVTDAALVRLEMTEVWLALDEPKHVVGIAQHIFTIFSNAGMLTGALAAVAYLKDAASHRRLTSADIKVVRDFVKRAARHPALQFVPPPRPPE